MSGPGDSLRPSDPRSSGDGGKTDEVLAEQGIVGNDLEQIKGILALLLWQRREEGPLIRESLIAQAAEKERRAAAWEAIRIVFASRYASIGVALICVAIALAIGSLAGVEIADLVVVLQAIVPWTTSLPSGS